MTADPPLYLPFSQRTGLEPIPPQLRLGEVSTQLRNLLSYALTLEIDRNSYAPYSGSIFRDKWKRVAMDIHVKCFENAIDTFEHSSFKNMRKYQIFIQTQNIGKLFDFIEIFIRHQNCSAELKHDLAQAFIESKSAYRVFDNEYIAAIGNDEQAAAFERAIVDAEVKNATPARVVSQCVV